MWWLHLLMAAVLLPFVVFYTVKLGAYAFYRGRFLAEKQNQREDF